MWKCSNCLPSTGKYCENEAEFYIDKRSRNGACYAVCSECAKLPWFADRIIGKVAKTIAVENEENTVYELKNNKHVAKVIDIIRMDTDTLNRTVDRIRKEIGDICPACGGYWKTKYDQKNCTYVIYCDHKHDNTFTTYIPTGCD